MSVPQRVVGDYHVDRQEVYARRRVQLTCTNGPSDFLKKKDKPRMKEAKLDRKLRIAGRRAQGLFSQVAYCGGYSGEVPPLPIPNREVKLTHADGTDPPGGRVGSRRSSEALSSARLAGLLFLSLRSSASPRRWCALSMLSASLRRFAGICRALSAPLRRFGRGFISQRNSV